MPPSNLSQQPPVLRCQSNRLIWYQNNYLGDLLPDQPHIHRGGRRTTYILVPNPPRTRCLRHLHLALQELRLGNSLRHHLVLQSLFLGPPFPSFHILPLLLPSFSLSLHFTSRLAFFSLPVPSMSFLPNASKPWQSATRNEQAAPQSQLPFVFFSKGGKMAVRSKKLE